MSIKELWDEYRIAKQLSSITGLMEKRDSEHASLEQDARLPDMTDDKVRHKHRIGRAIWVENTSVPTWFYHEIGYPDINALY